MITVIANDINYNEIFTLQLKNYVKKGLFSMFFLLR